MIRRLRRDSRGWRGTVYDTQPWRRHHRRVPLAFLAVLALALAVIVGCWAERA